MLESREMSPERSVHSMKNSAPPKFGLLFEEGIHARAILDRLAFEAVLPAGVCEISSIRSRRSRYRRLRRILSRLGLIDSVRRARDYLKYRSYLDGKRYKYNILLTSASNIARSEKVPFTRFAVANTNDTRVCDYLASSDIVYWIVATRDIVKKPLLNLHKGLINCHKGYLPDVRGLSATHWSILSGLPYGATAHIIDDGIDTGPIIVKKEFPIPKVRSLTQLVIEESYMIGDIAFEAIRCISKGLDLQPNENGRYFHSIHPILSGISLAVQINKT